MEFTFEITNTVLQMMGIHVHGGRGGSLFDISYSNFTTFLSIFKCFISGDVLIFQHKQVDQWLNFLLLKDGQSREKSFGKMGKESVEGYV